MSRSSSASSLFEVTFCERNGKKRRTWQEGVLLISEASAAILSEPHRDFVGGDKSLIPGIPCKAFARLSAAGGDFAVGTELAIGRHDVLIAATLRLVEDPTLPAGAAAAPTAPTRVAAGSRPPPPVAAAAAAAAPPRRPVRRQLHADLLAPFHAPQAAEAPGPRLDRFWPPPQRWSARPPTPQEPEPWQAAPRQEQRPRRQPGASFGDFAGGGDRGGAGDAPLERRAVVRRCEANDAPAPPLASFHFCVRAQDASGVDPPSRVPVAPPAVSAALVAAPAHAAPAAFRRSLADVFGMLKRDAAE